METPPKNTSGFSPLIAGFLGIAAFVACVVLFPILTIGYPISGTMFLVFGWYYMPERDARCQLVFNFVFGLMSWLFFAGLFYWREEITTIFTRT